MGVRGLLTYCRKILKHADMTVQGFRIGIDVYSLFFLFREKRDEFRKYLEGLKGLNHVLECIIDTRAQKEKECIVAQRKEVRKEASVQVKQLNTFKESDIYEGLDEQQRLILERYVNLKERDAWCVHKSYITWFRQMLSELNIELIVAEEEADILLSKGNYDVVVSSDSDLLIHCVKRLWIPRGTRWGIQHNEIDGEEFMKYIKLTHTQLYPLSFLAGCDVQPKKLVPIDDAIQLLRRYETLEKIHEKFPLTLTSEHIEAYYRLRNGAWKE
jgi:hypothetical protein